MGTHPIFESDFDCLTDMVTFDEFRVEMATLASKLDTVAYDEARAQYGELQKTFEIELAALPSHEQNLANRELHELHKKIEKRKPKKTFSLKKRSAPKPKVPVSEPVVEAPAVEDESNIELVPVTSNVSNQTINYQAENR